VREDINFDLQIIKQKSRGFSRDQGMGSFPANKPDKKQKATGAMRTPVAMTQINWKSKDGVVRMHSLNRRYSV
jgi:hypothetical protein